MDCNPHSDFDFHLAGRMASRAFHPIGYTHLSWWLLGVVS